jgi:hypothetical protein
MQLPALLTRVAGGSLGLPGVLSTDQAQMTCLLESLESAAIDQVRFFFAVVTHAEILRRVASQPLSTKL